MSYYLYILSITCCAADNKKTTFINANILFKDNCQPLYQQRSPKYFFFVFLQYDCIKIIT